MNTTEATDFARLPPELAQLEQTSGLASEADARPSQNSNGNSLTSNGSEACERPPAGENEVSNRRLACNPCRERKVRCDRGYPVCGRCAKMGHSCIYAAPSAPHITKLDLARLLQSLHTRLDQAENRMTLSSPPVPHEIQADEFSAAWANVSLGHSPGGQSQAFDPRLLPEINRGHPGPPQMQTSNTLSMPSMGDEYEWPKPEEVHVSDGALNGIESMGFTMQSTNDSHEIEAMFKDWERQSHSQSPESDARNQSGSNSASTISRLHAIYFDIFDPIMPIIHHSRFYTELQSSPNSTHLQALSYAMATVGTLAAGTGDDITNTAEACYTQSRTLLELCQRQGDAAVLSNISTLQACVLLCFYELKHPNFPRAWMSLGRATRLAKMMGLQRTDAGQASPADAHTGWATPLPPCLDAAEAEERRRTFWQLDILDAFAGMRIDDWVPAFSSAECKISMRLPCDGDLSSITTGSDMPTLSEIFDALGTNSLPPFAGHVVTMSLYKRCHDHQQAALRNPLNPFWDSFYEIDKSITQCRNGGIQGAELRRSPRPHRDATAGRGAFSLVSAMNLAAADIKLRMTAIHKAAKGQLQSTLLTEAVATCMAASGQIVAALRAGRQLKWREREVFQHSNCMYAWALSTVVQMHLWMMVNNQARPPSRDNTPGGGGGSSPYPSWSSHVDSLRFLSGATRELMSPEHIRPGLLEEVDKLVDQRERPPKRSHANLLA